MAIRIGKNYPLKMPANYQPFIGNCRILKD